MGHAFAAQILTGAEDYRRELEARWLEVLDQPTVEEARAGSWKPETWHGIRVRLRPATLQVQTELDKLARRGVRAAEESNAGNVRQVLVAVLDQVLLEVDGVEPGQLGAAKGAIAERYQRLVWRLASMSRELAAGALEAVEGELGNSVRSQDGPTA